jgi:uncharacterized protein YcnI
VIAALVVTGGAFAHARVSPPVSLSKELQLFSLAVPTEKEGVVTTKIVLTPPEGFSIDSVVPPPSGWRLAVKSQGSGEEAVVQKLTWSGGRTPTGQDSLFQFLGEPKKAGTYEFAVQQTYSDGSIVNWDGAADSENPTPTIEAKDSIGGGSSSVVADIALVVAVLALVAAGFALVRRGGGAGGSGNGGSGGGRALA